MINIYDIIIVQNVYLLEYRITYDIKIEINLSFHVFFINYHYSKWYFMPVLKLK